MKKLCSFLLIAGLFLACALLNEAGIDLTASDVNCDGSVDVVDALLIAQ